jgi:archaellum component FlaF (FlaF/FlaG flagellin family)
MDRLLTKWAHLSVQNKLRLAILGALLVLIGLVNSAIQEHRQERIQEAQRQLYQNRYDLESNSNSIDSSMDMMDSLMSH